MIHRKILSFFLIVLQLQAQEVRYLTPPKLGSDYVLQEVLCHRPRRESHPRVEREILPSGKTVIHAYGYGSGGWTLGWGAALEAINLLQPEDAKQTIVVVGAGVAGLMIAYFLIKAGHTPQAIVAQDFDNLTSHRAGGLFAHESSNPDQSIRDRVNGWISGSFKEYERIAKREHPDFKRGARKVPGYFADRATSDLEACVKAGVLPPAKDVIVDFKNGTQRSMVVYDENIFIETSVMLQQLRTFVESHGVQCIQKVVADFDELPESVIFNCTGLGAQKLVPTDAASLMPVQGHLLLLKGQTAEDLNYTLELELSTDTTDTGLSKLNLCYILPKKLPGTAENEIGVLGGTFIKGAYYDTPHQEEFTRVLERARVFFGMKD